MKTLLAARTIGLRFALGDIGIMLTFRFMSVDGALGQLVFDPDRPAFSWGELPPGTVGVVVRAYRIEKDLPWLTVLPDAIRYVPNQYDRYFIDFEGTFEGYLSRFSSKSRSTLKRKVRKFSTYAGGVVQWREFRSPDEMQRFYDLAREVSAKTYQERLLHAGLPETPQFRQRMSGLAEAGKARGYVLFHANQPIAYLFCPMEAGVLRYDYVGYDPTYSGWSPGTVLMYHVLERLFAEGGHRVFDFGMGGGPHKEFFSTAKARCADIYYWRRTVRNLATVCLHHATECISRACGRVLEALKVKGRVKKLLRGWHRTGAAPGTPSPPYPL